MKTITLAFIGAGNMGHGLISGLISDGYDPDKIWATDPSAEKLAQLRNQFGIHTTTDNQAAVAQADVVIFAVKPQILKAVALSLSNAVNKKNSLIISIAAGIREADLRQWLNTPEAAIVRCMPNTAALVRSSATGMYANPHVSLQQKNTAESVLRAVGITIWLTEEAQLDLVTALSGSGPAYFFYIMEAMEKAAIKAGLSAEAAHLLTAQTALGAGNIALTTTESFAGLRQRVTSPNGTTEAALKILHLNDVANAFGRAFQAAEQRAFELANSSGEN